MILIKYFSRNLSWYVSERNLYFIKIPIFSNKTILNFYMKLVFFLSNKWYIDYIYNNFLVKPFLVFNFNIFFNYFDKGLIEFFGPSEIITKSFKFSRFNSKIQFNFIKNFLSLIFFFILILLILFLYIYIIYKVF